MEGETEIGEMHY